MDGPLSGRARAHHQKAPRDRYGHPRQRKRGDVAHHRRRARWAHRCAASSAQQLSIRGAPCFSRPTVVVVRRVWLGAGLGLLVGLFVGVAFGWQMRNAAWRWGTAAEWAATAIVTAAAALAALLFARNQINETRATAERQRHDELADRLEQAFFDQLKPRVKEFDGRWETALATAKTSYDAVHSGADVAGCAGPQREA